MIAYDLEVHVVEVLEEAVWVVEGVLAVRVGAREALLLLGRVHHAHVPLDVLLVGEHAPALRAGDGVAAVGYHVALHLHGTSHSAVSRDF